MAHNIFQYDTGFLTDEAWHNHPLFAVLGRPLTLAEIEQVFGWTHSARPIFFQREDGTFVQIDGRSAMVRDDVEIPLSVMSDSYVGFGYLEQFTEIGQTLLDNGCIIETVGTLENGGKAFLSARLPAEHSVEYDGWSMVHQYVNFVDSLNGTARCQATNAAAAVVCANTFHANVLHHSNPKLYKISHKTNGERNLTAALMMLDGALKEAQMTHEAIERLINTVYTEAEFMAMVPFMLNDKGVRPTDEGKGQTQFDNTFDDIVARYHNDDIVNIRETALGALMCCQGWGQHIASVKGKSSRGERHLMALASGKGDNARADKGIELIHAAIADRSPLVAIG